MHILGSAICQSGMISLPSERTLSDYTHWATPHNDVQLESHCRRMGRWLVGSGSLSQGNHDYFRMCHKVTKDHVWLTSFTRMWVHLAAQIGHVCSVTVQLFTAHASTPLIYSSWSSHWVGKGIASLPGLKQGEKQKLTLSRKTMDSLKITGV